MYKSFVAPLLDRLDSETWHDRARHALYYAQRAPLGLRAVELAAGGRTENKRLGVNLAGIALENPVMVGAGWDKSGIAVSGLHALGFSSVEVGTVTALPQPGNTKPRQWVLGPGVALNQLGFNSPGMEAVAHNLDAYSGSGIPLGISVGKNRDVPAADAPEAHAVVVHRLYPYAAYFAINVSSPNSPGLRSLQDKGPLTEIVRAVIAAMEERGGRKPLFVKIAPELSNEATDDVLDVVLQHGLSGVIAANTTNLTEVKARYGERWRDEAGGVSGDDTRYRSMTTAKVRYIYRATEGAIDIIGVGGVKDASTALEKIAAGAKVVQVVTAIRGEGPGVANRINRGLIEWMDRAGVRNIGEAVGTLSGDCVTFSARR